MLAKNIINIISFLFLFSICGFAQSVATNIRIEPQPSAFMVFYDLDVQSEVNLYASFDGEAWFGPLRNVAGSVGSHVQPGSNKIALWHTTSEINYMDPTIQLKLIAIDRGRLSNPPSEAAQFVSAARPLTAAVAAAHNPETARQAAANTTQATTALTVTSTGQTATSTGQATAARPVQQAARGSFHVIVGSFYTASNAQGYAEGLTRLGITNIEILQSSEGLYRVSVGTFSTQTAAMRRVNELKAAYPDHEDIRDSWMLR
jgi:hypothetical protein